MRIGIFGELAAAAMSAAVMLGVGAGVAANAGEKHDHSHDHAHAHDHAADDAVYRGYFDDDQIAPRTLSDWEGEWRSVYPLLLSGALDPVMAHKAEHGGGSAEEYRAYYRIGYETTVDRIVIEGDGRVSFDSGDEVVSGRYGPDGYEVLTYRKGNRGVRFIFEKKDGDAEAPHYIQFSDHAVAPVKADHFHLYWGDDRAALLDELTNWPSYYPAALGDAEIVKGMLAH